MTLWKRQKFRKSDPWLSETRGGGMGQREIFGGGIENVLQFGYVGGYVNMFLKTHPTVHQKW